MHFSFEKGENSRKTLKNRILVRYSGLHLWENVDVGKMLENLQIRISIWRENYE